MRRIEVVDYRPEWPNDYRHEEERLTSALGDCLVAAHHIGSTSVPGLAAKPVIDILMEVRDLDELDSYDAAMAALGYEVMGEFGIERRRFYRKGGDQRTHHVHAFPAGDTHVTRHLAFREYLVAHPEVAAEYSALKQRVVMQCQHDSDRYGAGKADFIHQVQAQAMSWSGG